MILFLYGPDSFRSKQKLDEIILRYKESKKSGLNLISLDAKELEFSDFYNTFKVSSMFVEKKLVIVKNVFSNKKFQEDFLKSLKDIEVLSDVVVLYESEEVDQRLKLFKTLLKESKCQEFSVLSGLALKKWAQQEFEKLGQKINVDALDYLLQCTASDLWRTSSVVQQLTSYKNKAVIKKEDVVAFVKPSITTDIFRTIDSLAQKDKRQALNLIHKHLDDGEAPLYLLTMIAYQFKNLLIVKELAQKGLMYASIVKKSGLHPFVVKKTYYLCNQFSFEELKKIYHNIFRVDLDIKTGKIEPEMALDLLVAKI